jgi:hypothetical protein
MIRRTNASPQMLSNTHHIVVRMSYDCAPADTPHIKSLIGSLVDIYTNGNGEFESCFVESITQSDTDSDEDFITVTTDYEMDNHLEGVKILFKNIEQITYL